MRVIPLSEASAELVDLVGGKAAGLGELIRQGERVPPGFCVTTEAHRLGVLPEAEIADAWERLGGGPVAVRSSATAEDLPEASFAGQHDTVLGVTGKAELAAAITKCWDSLHGTRATAYRDARDIDHAAVRMAVVVQRMVDAETAGVLFTANPLTGRRTEMMVDAAAGLGTAVVDGAAAVDHYLLDGSEQAATGCLTPARLAELRAAGERLQERFGAPQDVEWAFDSGGTLWLLQSRPITTLFPVPPPTGDPLPRVYLEFGHVQGMLQPVTPMGMSSLKGMIAAMTAALGLRVEIVDIGGRLYGDLTDMARHKSARKRLIKLLAVDFGPRAQTAMRHVLADPRFAPGTGGRARPAEAQGAAALRTAARALAGIVRALARPDAARVRLFDAVERMRLAVAAPDDLHTAADRLRFVRGDGSADGADEITWPIVAGLLASALPAHLLKGVARTDEIHTVLSGMPHNVTIEMDLALWRIADRAGEHRRLLLDTPPAELAARYLRGGLPEIGLAEFLEVYGHRGPAEADLGVPRWAEDPAPVFAAIANCLRVTDPQQAPDRRFARAAATAEATLGDLIARARRRRPVRGRIAAFLLRRARSLAGLREAGKFAGLYRLRAVRQQLLLLGADLAGAGLLDEPGDIMFLTLDEAGTAVHDRADHRDIVTGRKAVYRAESRRRTVPVALLSDGTDVESVLPPQAGVEGVLSGVGAAAGRVTGPARVVLDPATAHLEPGDILVASTTDPGWTPLFLTAAALVTETGAIMAHGPTVAREYGIPAVISVPGATERITTGQVITVDGAAGTVTFGEAADAPTPADPTKAGGGRIGPLLRRAATTEVVMWRALYDWLRRKPLALAAGDRPFGYLGVIKPILGVFIGLSIVEIPILDLIVRHVVPWPPARWITLVLSVWGLLWMIGFFANLRAHPHIVGDAGIRVRLGAGIDFTVPWANLASVAKSYRSLPSSKSVQVEQEHGRRVLHIGVGSQTSVDVRLREPATFVLPKGPSEPVDEVRLYADDPDGLVRVARDRLTADSPAGVNTTAL